MDVRRLFRRTRPFRYAGFWTLAVSALLLAGPVLEGQGRAPVQLAVGVLFCALWPWLADRLRARGPVDESLPYEMVAYWGECAVAGLVLTWTSLPPLPLFAATVCLLGGAVALAGARLLVPAGLALGLGAAAGASLAPRLTIVSTPGADAVALMLVLGFSLSLGHVGFRQAQRLHVHRQSLAEKSAVLERINGRMQRYLPPSLRDRLSRAPDDPCDWERRWLTVAFVDLVGFTELSERLEAELLASILDEYLAALIPAAEGRGGEVSKLLGDGVLVVFGLRDAAHRRLPVEAALAFCHELPALLETLARRWRSRGEPVSLRMRAGIASGFCTLGDRGGADRLDFTLIGPPVNLASRLQSHAAVNGVLMDEATAALAEAGHRLPAPQVLEVKGVGTLPVYAVSPAS